MEKVKLLFEDLTFNSNYEFLEESSKKDKLKEILEKKGIEFSEKDFGFFKCKYAFVDKKNLNGCILPRKEVKKALGTLSGKPIDKDHLRKSVIGFWLDGELVDDDINAYGCFWKSNFSEEYAEMKEKFKKGEACVSFEAWGEKQHNEDGSYNLNEIEFAGGALLYNTKPAFPDAEVIEFSKYRNRVLEFAKIVKEGEENKIFTGEMKDNKIEEFTVADLESIEGALPAEVIKRVKELIKDGKSFKEALKTSWKEYKEKNPTKSTEEIKIEESKLNFNYDKETIGRMMYETICPTCDVKGWNDIQMIDFENNKVKSKCPGCGGISMYDLTPTANIIKRGKKPEPVKATENKFSIDNIEDFEGTDEEVEMNLSSLVEGEYLIDIETSKKIDVAKKLTYQERKNISDDMFAVVVNVKNKITGKPRKIRMFPIEDKSHVLNALARLPQAKETLQKLGIKMDTVEKKILKRAKELNMTSLLKRHNKGGVNRMDELLQKYNKSSVEELVPYLVSEIEMLKSSLTKKDEEIATLTSAKETLQKSFDETKVSLDKANSDLKDTKDILDKKIVDEKASVIKVRKEELGPEFSKDIKDEDILDDTKFELAKTKKELADLKKKGDNKGLNGGSVEQGTIDPIFKKQESIRKKAFDEI